MTPELSVLLPTVRPQQWRRSYDSIAPAAGSVSHEVVIVADFAQPADVEAVWLEQSRQGPIAAIQAAVMASTGTYLFVMNDESRLAPGALEILYRTAQQEPRAIYTPRHLPDYPFVYYGKPFAAFPFVHRDVVTDLGGLLDPVYLSFYADPDLSLRAHQAGIPIRTIQDAVIRHDNRHDDMHRNNVSQYLGGDRATFRARWDHLGTFADP